MTPEIQALHAIYCRESGLKVRLTLGGRTDLWCEWLKAEFTQADLITVLRHIRAEVRAKRRFPGSLTMGSVLQPDRFEDLLELAKAQQRNYKPLTDRESVLKATGRQIEPPAQVKTPQAILPDPKTFAEGLRKMREAI